MSKGLFLTKDWPFEKVARYGKDITRAMHLLVDKFPQDATPKSLMADLMSGAIQLWLMLDGEKFIGIVLTDVQTVEATGHKAVRVMGLGGEAGIENAAHIAAIEEWAWEQGADEVCPVGRLGWKKPLAPLGYEIDRVIYKKARPA